MTKKLFILIITLFIFGCKVQQRSVSNKNNNTSYVPIDRREYINSYNSLAIKEMYRSQIPASITLAQALLESDNGNSTLAKKANNHFGIKCHDWKGKSVKHDDDAKNVKDNSLLHRVTSLRNYTIFDV